MNSTFVLEAKDDENIVQGSAFYAQDIGLFTSYHVTEGEGFFKVYRCRDYDETSIATIAKVLHEKSADKSIDYALYDVQMHTQGFQMGDSKELKVGDKVTIVCYPNHKRGNTAYVQPCTITSQTNLFGAPFYTVSGRIVHGASGGAVINQNLEVVGIIKGGVVDISKEDESENQGFVPIHCVLEHLHGEHMISNIS